MKIHLPVDDYIHQIKTALKTNSSVVVTAAPGAGKTTRIPPALVEISAKKVLVLEPRRIAAIAAANRVAEENNQTLGQEVGFEVRFDRKISGQTRLIFVTEALLTRKILADPSLEEFDVVIIDEFHERSLHTDLAIGLLKELQELERSDLKIVVMSATLDAQKLSDFLGKAPIVDVPGRLCALDVTHDSKSQSLVWNFDVSRKMVDKIKSAVLAGSRDTLVFFPGVYEIEQVRQFLGKENWSQKFNILALHGRLDLQEQQQALRPSEKRKIILSTNVAESSVTVDGLDTVVDSGLERSAVFQMQSGFSKLTTHRISLASATQRAGRAARQFPGKCFKLWSPLDERSFAEYSLAEVKSQDLSETLLTLFFLGLKDLKNFSWFEIPPTSSMDFAFKKLIDLSLVKDDVITDLGRKIVRYPLPMRLALLMENFKIENREDMGAWICAMLSERGSNSIGKENSLEECDLIFELKKGSHFLERYHKAAFQLSKMANQFRWRDTDEEVLKKVLVKSFADRLGKRRSGVGDKGLLSSGRGVTLSKYSVVKKSPYFVALEGTDTENSNETQISRASGVSEEFLRKNFSQHIKAESHVNWDETKKTFIEKKTQKLFGLSIGSEHSQPAKPEWIEAHLPEVAFENWDWLLKQNHEMRNWWLRFSFYAQNINPDFKEFWSDERLRNVLSEATYGKKNLHALQEADLVYFFENQLPGETLAEFRSNAPVSLEAAKGRQVKVHYHGEQAPFVEVRIQDAFPWKKHPKVGNDILITVVLLAPNQRPTQVTKDLEGFWKGSYKEVRKELKARYPKHDWPEDPSA
jgi:ATP-dependent helicase HrpB